MADAGRAAVGQEGLVYGEAAGARVPLWSRMEPAPPPVRCDAADEGREERPLACERRIC